MDRTLHSGGSHTGGKRAYGAQNWLLACTLLAVTLGLQPLLTESAHARAFTTEATGETTLRCSTAPTVSIPDEVLDRYDVTPDRDSGLLSCVVQQQETGGSWRNRRGEIAATASTLTGIAEELRIREILDESTIGYIATYPLPASGPLRFNVLVETGDDDADIRIEFDDLRPRQ
ncbi:MAG: DUF4426 domain-containing protein [Pseudomonadales bacterium]